jgi:hypothetical protein
LWYVEVAVVCRYYSGTVRIILMADLAEKIAIMQHFLDGGEVELTSPGSKWLSLPRKAREAEWNWGRDRWRVEWTDPEDGELCGSTRLNLAYARKALARTALNEKGRIVRYVEDVEWIDEDFEYREDVQGMDVVKRLDELGVPIPPAHRKAWEKPDGPT